MASLVDYYGYYKPIAPVLHYTILPKSTTITTPNTKTQNMTYTGSTTVALNFTPYGTDFVDVFVNGQNIVNKNVDSIVGGYTHSRFMISDSTLTWVEPPNVNDELLIVGYFGFSESASYFMDLTSILIQGKILNNTNPNFGSTGGVECYPVIYFQPQNGVVRPSWNKQGFEYSFLKGGPLGDSFSYKLVSRYGQESEPSCIFINQGVTGSTS